MTAIKEALQEAAMWLHAAYDRPPQTPECKAMLARVDAALAQEVPQEPIAWLFKAYRPGRRAEWAAVDRDDPIWRDDERWENVERFPLGVMGEGETLRGTPQVKVAAQEPVGSSDPVVKNLGSKPTPAAAAPSAFDSSLPERLCGYADTLCIAGEQAMADLYAAATIVSKSPVYEKAGAAPSGELPPLDVLFELAEEYGKCWAAVTDEPLTKQHLNDARYCLREALHAYAKAARGEK